MPPKQFYEVDRRINFFGLVPDGDAEVKPEEKVRQWVLSELLSTYGFTVNCLDVETSVKIGSRNPVRIDVLIRKDGSPWIVVECKEQGFLMHEKALLQAISYANADSIRAEFVVYTNGKEWQVKRRFAGEWVFVPDIAKRVSQEDAGSVENMLTGINEIKPLLYWVGRPLEGRYGIPYIVSLQHVFNGHFWCWRQELNRKFVAGLDFLTRCLLQEDLDKHYSQQTLPSAFEKFSKVYAQYTGKPIEFFDVQSGVNACRFAFEDMLPAANSTVPYPEVLLMRISVVLLQITQKSLHGRKYADMNDEFRLLGIEVEKLLEYVLCASYDVKFADVLVEGNCYSLETLCESRWRNVCAEAKQYGWGAPSVPIKQKSLSFCSKLSSAWSLFSSPFKGSRRN